MTSQTSRAGREAPGAAAPEPAPPASQARPARTGSTARTGRPGAVLSSLYFLVDTVLAFLWTGLILAGCGIGIGTAVIWSGLPILAATMSMWRGIARCERGLVRGMLHVDIPDPYLPLLAEGAGWLRRWRARASDPATWKDLLYLTFVNPLVTTFFLGLTAALWGSVAALLSMWYWYQFIPGDRIDVFSFGAHHTYMTIDSTRSGLVWVPVGVALLGLTILAVRGFGRAKAAVARGLLGPSTRAMLHARNVVLAESRRRAVEAAEEERRRIERDLHDGTQQRLVALALDLGMAREKFATEPGAAQALVEEAHGEAKRALTELRDLVRGIHPAVLTDRGLDAALSALAGRSPVPVEISVRVPRRPHPALEAVAYFVVAEALTNVAKHSGAEHAAVRVEQAGGYLIVEVRDDGHGGARLGRAGGLAGLADRAAGVDGTLEVDSPEGGPTVVRMELPCGS